MDCVPRSSSALPLKKRSLAPPPEEDDDEEVVAMAVGAPVATASASKDDEGRVTPVYGVEATVVDDADDVDVEEVEVVNDSDEEEPPVANEELEGDWKVLSGGTVQIGTVHVRFPPTDAGAEGGGDGGGGHTAAQV